MTATKKFICYNIHHNADGSRAIHLLPKNEFGEVFPAKEGGSLIMHIKKGDTPSESLFFTGQTYSVTFTKENE